MSDQEPSPPVSRRPKRRRWGMWALAFLTIAFVAVLTSGDGWTNRGALALLGGMSGAAYSSYRGIKEFSWLPR